AAGGRGALRGGNAGNTDGHEERDESDELAQLHFFSLFILKSAPPWGASPDLRVASAYRVPRGRALRASAAALRSHAGIGFASLEIRRSTRARAAPAMPPARR